MFQGIYISFRIWPYELSISRRKTNNNLDLVILDELTHVIHTLE